MSEIDNYIQKYTKETGKSAYDGVETIDNDAILIWTDEFVQWLINKVEEHMETKHV